LTALHASSEEITEWLDSKNPAKAGEMNQCNDGEKRLKQSQEASSSGSNNASAKYSFICECFFMTARVLNLGLLKAFSDFKHLVQVELRFSSLILWGLNINVVFLYALNLVACYFSGYF
jgi:ubiquitin conjugation factor E4 B